MLTGTYEYTLDAKGRVVLPAEHRARLGRHVVLLRAADRYLLLCSKATWDRTDHARQVEPWWDAWAVTSAHAAVVDYDNGRILLPHALRQWADLQPRDDVAIAGCREYVAICAKSRWDEHLQCLNARLLALLEGA